MEAVAQMNDISETKYYRTLKFLEHVYQQSEKLVRCGIIPSD